MGFKRMMLLLLVPVAIAACDSGQPTYSASNAASAPPPPPPPVVAQLTPAPAPPPVAQTQPEPTVAPSPALVEPPRIKPPADSATRFAHTPPGQIGPVNKLGVGSCDTYIERYRTCFNNTKLAREQKFPLRRALMQQVRQWRDDTRSGKISDVAAACTEAERKAQGTFTQLGCKAF